MKEATHIADCMWTIHTPTPQKSPTASYPRDKTYDELVQTLSSPAPSAIVQRFKFNKRIHKSGESVITYVAKLKALREHCGFGDQLNEMARDDDNHMQAMDVSARNINDLQK